MRELPSMHQGAHGCSQPYAQGINGLSAHLAPALGVCIRPLVEQKIDPAR